MGFGSSAPAVAALQSVAETSFVALARPEVAASAGFASSEGTAHVWRRTATLRPEEFHQSLLCPAIHSCSAGKAPVSVGCCSQGSATKLAWQAATVWRARAGPCVAKHSGRQPFAPAPAGQAPGASLSLARQGL